MEIVEAAVCCVLPADMETDCEQNACIQHSLSLSDLSRAHLVVVASPPLFS